MRNEDRNFTQPPFSRWAKWWAITAVLLTALLYYNVVLVAYSRVGWQTALLVFAGLSGYLIVAYRVTIRPDYEDVGWWGGFINQPFRFTDDYNRALIFLKILFFPGKWLSKGIVTFWKLLKQ